MNDDFSALADFRGTARLFPLPNLVLFPHVMQPLHIFEPRYREMTTDALDGDRLLALVLLQAGWEADYDGQPAIHSVACLSRIFAEQRLDDSRFNLLMRGLSRIHITAEIDTGKRYRIARAELLVDANVPGPAADRKLRREFARQVPAWFAGQASALEQFRALLKSAPPVGVLCDIIAFALPLEVEFKQHILETLNVERRARLLLQHMKANKPEDTPAPAKRKFPPEFSAN